MLVDMTLPSHSFILCWFSFSSSTPFLLSSFFSPSLLSSRTCFLAYYFPHALLTAVALWRHHSARMPVPVRWPSMQPRPNASPSIRESKNLTCICPGSCEGFLCRATGHSSLQIRPYSFGPAGFPLVLWLTISMDHSLRTTIRDYSHTSVLLDFLRIVRSYKTIHCQRSSKRPKIFFLLSCFYIAPPFPALPFLAFH